MGCPRGTTSCGHSCVSHLVASLSHACADRCLPLSAPCRGKCSPGWTLCGDSCLSKEDQTDWQECDGKCIGSTRACRGACSPGTLKCGGRCLEDRLHMQQLFYACGEECQLFSEPCRGACPTGTRPCRDESKDDGKGYKEGDRDQTRGEMSSEIIMSNTWLAGMKVNLSQTSSASSGNGSASGGSDRSAQAAPSTERAPLKCCSLELSRLMPSL
jgi:hypothetical protein